MAGRLLLIGELNDDLSELRIGFEALGLTVDTAPDSLAGLEQGKEFQPDLVVTEILTNRLSGFELASRISRGEAGFAAPVIFYTEFYRDEKARRDVLAKYGAIQYFVRPLQKEALKKSVATHFQEFLSSLAAVPIAGASTPEPATSAPEVNTVVPQLSRAAVAAEKQPTNPLPGTPIQPGEPGGVSGEVPTRFRAFTSAAQRSSSDVTDSEPQAAEAIADEPGNQPVAKPALGAAKVPASVKDSKLLKRSLLLPAEEPPLIGRLAQSTPVRIAALVIVAVLAVYLVRDRFQGGNKDASTPPETLISTPPSPPAQDSSEPSAQLASPPAMVPSDAPRAQDQPAPAVAKPGTEPEKPPLSSATELSRKPDSVKKADTEDSSTAAPERSPALSIQDVTGSGKGPVLRKMKPIQLSQDVLSSLAAKSVVVRVVIDNTGKVTEVSPLNQEGAAFSLPPEALATIQQWEFSRSRRKDASEAVKYFSLKVRNPR